MQNDGVPCDASFGSYCIKVQYTLKGLMTSAMVVGVTIGQALSGEWENPVPSKLRQAVQGTDHAARPVIQDMGIDHGGTHIGMPRNSCTVRMS